MASQASFRYPGRTAAGLLGCRGGILPETAGMDGVGIGIWIGIGIWVDEALGADVPNSVQGLVGLLFFFLLVPVPVLFCLCLELGA